MEQGSKISEINYLNILENIPLRVSITDHCNLNCFFCSNEGMSYENRNKASIDVDDFNTMIDILLPYKLGHVSLTGGDPTEHPELEEILKTITKRVKKRFFHTNGVNLEKELIDEYYSNFQKLAVSIHSPVYSIWKKVTNGNKNQYLKLMDNLDYLSGSDNVEIKMVAIEGYTNSHNNIKQMLEFCNDNGFKLKVLNFEAQNDSQKKLIPDFKNVMAIMEKAGARKLDSDNSFRGQASYLPFNWFEYKDIKAVVINIGCGREAVCTPCYSVNEIFVTPYLKIKPCHSSLHEFDISTEVKEKDGWGLFNKIVESREFLRTKPGLDSKYWRRDER
ncbi:MAG: radical SAM protein [Promethearchaeota archaeon]